MEKPYKLTCAIIVCTIIGSVRGQNEEVCYGAGSITASVILTFIFTLVLIWLLHYWKNKRSKTEQLILETDPEKGKGDFAFDNPGFKDAPCLTTPQNKQKWTQWSPLSVLNVKLEKPEKKKSSDDLNIDENEVKVVSLRSEDFTGLGFNICGNMREGIYVKDVLHRGPAFDSGKLNSGDRINSVTINFEHVVYEDALAILSYASPYELIIEAKGGKLLHNIPGQQKSGEPGHPVYKSSSHLDLHRIDNKIDYTTSNLDLNLERKENDVKQEKVEEMSIDEVDVTINDSKPPEYKKREKKLERNELNSSGIKRDKEGIPLELPDEMLNAVTAVMNNRSNKEKKNYSSNQEQSDSEIDDSSVNTIELNSSDITIHQTEENRKTVSTGDLTKITNGNKTSTLERAQSLDISDSVIPTLCKKNNLTASTEDLFQSELFDKEPRLSLIVDGLNTFQRNRLKKSTEWGNLEDAILKQDSDTGDSNEFTAVVMKINEIKSESDDKLRVKNEIWPNLLESSDKKIDTVTITNNESINNISNDIEVESEPETEESSIIIEQPNKVVNNRIYEPFELSSNKESIHKRQRVPDDKEVLQQPPESNNTEEILSKIPLLNTLVKESINVTDDYKIEPEQSNVWHTDKEVKDITDNFIQSEKLNNDSYNRDSNISDDIKVSLEKKHVSNVNVTNGDLHSLELTINDNNNTESSNNNTYVTEIKVSTTPIPINRNLDEDFENYVKNFESKLDSNIEIESKLDVELDKIQKIAEQQLKKLPEMKFTTSSYETNKSNQQDKRFSVEQLKSNYEKSIKSRIPIATSKTPPTSPERRDSRNLDNENDKAILELMSSSIANAKSKPTNKNVTVTSIRSNSKIPSGLPTLGGAKSPKKIDLNDDPNTESSFKQWVFNPGNVTSVTVTQKDDKK